MSTVFVAHCRSPPLWNAGRADRGPLRCAALLTSACTERAQQVAAAAGVGYYVYSSIKAKMENRPPCPSTLPILGNFHLLTPDPETGTPPVHKHMFKLTRKHGDVMGFWFGSKYTVVLSSPEAIYEALKEKGDDFSGRFVPESMNIITRGAGIALQPDLEKWGKARKMLVNAVSALTLAPALVLTKRSSTR